MRPTYGRILRITGRNDDMLIIRGVNVYPSQLEAVMVGRPQLAPYYQLVVQRRGVLDEVDIEIEAQPGVPSERFDGAGARAGAPHQGARGHQHQREGMGRGPSRARQGKAVRVRDLRRKEQ